MTRQRRVAVSSPQTRLAVARGRTGVRRRLAPLPPLDAELAERMYVEQRRRAVSALLLVFGLIFGLPVLLFVWPELGDLHIGEIPLGWLMVATLPYPAMGLLAWWQLRRAERVEDGE